MVGLGINFLPKLNHTPARLITPCFELGSFHHALDLNNFRAEGQSSALVMDIQNQINKTGN